MKIPSPTGVPAGVTAGVPDERPRGRRRAVVAGLVATGLISSSLILPGVAAAALPVFPDNIVIFPNRDMVVLEGFDSRDGQEATIEVRRGDQLMGAVKGKIAAGGEFEVNHPGGACWGNDPSFPQVTPDIKAGDKIEVKFAEGGTTFVAADATVQDGFVEKVNYTDGATTFTVTGTVQEGKAPADMEQRIVNPDLTDTLVARRDVRAVTGGVAQGPRGGYTSELVVTGNTFEARYDFALSGDQAVANARTAATGGGERLMTWQETDAAGNRQGLTIAEFGETGGPGMGGCPAGPGSVAPTPGTYGAVWNGATAQVTWSPAAAQPGAPAVSGYSVEAVAKTPDAAGLTPVLGVRTGANATRADLTVPSGAAADYTLEVRPLITGGGVGAAFATAGSTPNAPAPAPGDTEPPVVEASQNAAGELVLTSEAGAEIYYTTDGTDPIAAGVLAQSATLYTAPVPVTAATTFKAAAYDAANNAGPVVEYDATVPDAPAATAPGAPAGVTVTAGTTAGTATVTWTAPADTGGAAIEKYDVTVDPAPSGTQAAPADPAATSRTITGLTNGTQYTVTVTATNSVGTSPVSAAATYRAGDTVSVATARWKTGDFRVTGTGTLNGATVTVHRVNADGTIGTPINGASALVTANAYSIRVRNGAPTANPGRIIVKSSGGGQTAPFTVTNG